MLVFESVPGGVAPKTMMRLDEFDPRMFHIGINTKNYTCRANTIKSTRSQPAKVEIGALD